MWISGLASHQSTPVVSAHHLRAEATSLPAPKAQLLSCFRVLQDHLVDAKMPVVPAAALTTASSFSLCLSSLNMRH